MRKELRRSQGCERDVRWRWPQGFASQGRERDNYARNHRACSDAARPFVNPGADVPVSRGGADGVEEVGAGVLADDAYAESFFVSIVMNLFLTHASRGFFFAGVSVIIRPFFVPLCCRQMPAAAPVVLPM